MTSRDTSPPLGRQTGRPPALILLGRVVLVAAPLLWVAATALRSSGLTAHGIDLFQAYVLAALAIGSLSPWLLLPVGTTAHATLTDGTLEVVTVLGTRRIDLDDLRRVGAVKVWWQQGDPDLYLYLRGPGLRVVWLLVGDTPWVSSAVRTRLARTAARRPGVATPQARAALRIDPRPGRAHLLALEVFAFVAGLQAWVCGMGAVALLLVTAAPGRS